MERFATFTLIAFGFFALGVWEGPVERHRVIPPDQVQFFVPNEPYSLMGNPLRVQVNLGEQRIAIMSKQKVIAWADITTGASHSPTPAGLYSVIRKERHYRSVLFDADMPHALFFTVDGIAIHGGRLHEGPMTGGCVRVPFDFARWLFRHVQTGTEIIIS